MAEKSEIEGAASAVKGILEAVPVYQDVLQPAAREVGVALQTVTKTVHILLAPVSMLVWGYDQIREYVGTRVAEKLGKVPPERLTSPELNVAGPALESLRYTGHAAELREMYASLLATAMDTATKKKAHPAFVEIIKQMCPEEARMLEALMNHFGACPLLDVRAVSEEGRGSWVLKYFTALPYEIGCVHPELGPTYLVNLQRLGLVELREKYRLVHEDGVDRYEDLKSHPEIVKLHREIQASPRTVDYWYGAVHITPMGRVFCEACMTT